MSQRPIHQVIHETYQLGPAYHMTHIQNFSEILKTGALVSYNQMRGKAYLNLANEDVQAGRAAISIAATGRPLHDYVPLYLGFKTPMVAVNKTHNEELLFLRFSLNMLALGNIVISDGNARSTKTKFKLFTRIEDLSFLDVKSIRTVKYAHDAEVKRKKQAELLVPDQLFVRHLLDIICFSEKTRSRTLVILNQFGINTPVLVRPGWYFTQ